MITTYATIKLLEGENGQIKVTGINTTNNPNSAQISSVIGSKAKGSKPFMLGVSKLDGTSKFMSSVPYFIGTIKADENGKLPYDVHIDLQYENKNVADNLTIVFDTYNNQYPTKIYVEGIEYNNDDPIFSIKTNSKDTVKQIGFNTWNTPNYPIRIESISLGLKIDIDRRNKISYNGIIKDRADIEQVSWGIVSNTGSISFNDTTGEISDYADQNLLTKGLNVYVYLKDTLTGKEQQLGVYQTDIWEYDNNNYEVNVSLQDDLTEWQNILFEGYKYTPKKTVTHNCTFFYELLWRETPKKYNMLEISKLDEKTKNILENTHIMYPLLEASSLWSAWEKLCQVCQLKIYKTSNGTTVCKYNKGN